MRCGFPSSIICCAFARQAIGKSLEVPDRLTEAYRSVIFFDRVMEILQGQSRVEREGRIPVGTGWRSGQRCCSDDRLVEEGHGFGRWKTAKMPVLAGQHSPFSQCSVLDNVDGHGTWP